MGKHVAGSPAGGNASSHMEIIQKLCNHIKPGKK